jgi:outer membrane biosynthesis protein TonB
MQTDICSPASKPVAENAPTPVPSTPEAMTLKPTAHRRRVATLIAIVAATAALIAGCSSGSDSSATLAMTAAAEAPNAAPVPQAFAAATTAAAASGGAGIAYDAAGAPVAEAAREVITTGSASIVADDPSDAAARVADLTEKSGGRVEARQEQEATDNQPAAAHLTLRLPADAVNTTIDAFRTIGKVTDVTLNKQDVTAQGADLDARIGALQTSTGRLSELLAKAGNVADLLEVERELAARQADLDSLKAQRAALSDQVAMSTLDVSISATPATVAALAEPAPGFVGGLSAGWKALVAFGRGLAVAVGALLPWLVAAAIVAAIVLVIIRIVRKRRPKQPKGDGAAQVPSSVLAAPLPQVPSYPQAPPAPEAPPAPQAPPTPQTSPTPPAPPASPAPQAPLPQAPQPPKAPPAK